MLDAEYRRVVAALTTKKVQNKESVINKRRSREERTARMHRKNGDKENSKEKPASKTNNRHTNVAVLNELFGHATVNKLFDQKRTKDSNELELIWQKRDITRMRDSEIFLQMENMRRYAETETRGIVNMKKQLDCEELERLEDIARQRELMQLTYLRAKGGRDVVQKDVVDNNFKNDFSSEVDDLAQIATQMKKLKIKSYRSLNAPRTQLSHNENELDNGPDGEESTDAFDGMEMNTKKCKKNTFEPRDSLEYIGLLKKRKGTLRKSHEQRKKLERMRREPQAEAAEKETCVSSGSLHKTISKLSNRVSEKCSANSCTSTILVSPAVTSKVPTEAKTKRSAGVKVPRSKCKHYRNNKNMPQRRRKTSKKHQTNSSVGHTEPCELSAHNSLELLRQRKRGDKRLRVSRNSCVKIDDSSSSKAVSKSELLRITSCTTNELPSTSKAAVKSCTAVQESTFPTSDNETRFEPSTSSLEEMFVHIKSQLKQRKNKKYSISDSSRQKRQLQQQCAKKAEKSNKVKSRSTSRKRTNKAELPASKKASKTRKRHKRSLTESVRIPLVRNNEFILGQQNDCMETAYATDTRSQYKNSLQNLTPPASQPPKTGRKRKLYKKTSNVVQESEA
uniref:Uncharacterized protein n=1 Tax=Zeugodacus cucurbitae TaxID=28588 RepID=A0A0A1X6X7_ZEUCU